MPNTRAYFDLAGAMIIVGSSAAAGKLVIAELPVHLSMALRFVVAVALAVPLLYIREGGFGRISLRSLGVFALQAFCGVYLFNALLLMGLEHTSAAAAGIITSTTPAFMAVLAFGFMGERITGRVALGIVAAVGGILVLNLSTGDALGATGLWGNLLVLGAVAAESCFLLLRKGVRENVSPLAASTIISVLGLLIFLPQGAVEAAGFDFSAVSGSVWLTVLYYGVFVSVVAYVLWFRGIVAVEASVAGIFTAIMPLSAVFFSWLAVGERLGWEHASGCGLVLAAIWCISVPGRRSSRPGAARPDGS